MTSVDRVVLGIPWYWILCLAIAALSVLCGIITCICMDKRMKKKMLEYLSEHDELNSVKSDEEATVERSARAESIKTAVKRLTSEPKPSTSNELGRKPSKRRDSLTHVFTPKVNHPERRTMKSEKDVDTVDAIPLTEMPITIQAEIQILKPMTEHPSDCVKSNENIQLSDETQTTMNQSRTTEVHLAMSSLDDVKNQRCLNRSVLLGNYFEPDVHVDMSGGTDYNKTSTNNEPKNFLHNTTPLEGHPQPTNIEGSDIKPTHKQVGSLKPRGSGLLSTQPDIITTVDDEITLSTLPTVVSVMNAVTITTVRNSTDTRRSSTNSENSKQSLTSLHDAVVDQLPEVIIEPTVARPVDSVYSSSAKSLPSQAAKVFEGPLWNLQLGATLFEESESVVDFSDRGASESEDELNVTDASLSIICEGVDRPKSRIGTRWTETLEETDTITNF